MPVLGLGLGLSARKQVEPVFFLPFETTHYHPFAERKLIDPNRKARESLCLRTVGTIYREILYQKRVVVGTQDKMPM